MKRASQRLLLSVSSATVASLAISGLAISGSAASGLTADSAAQSAPAALATVPAPTLKTGQATIYRDRYGTPHIYAEREEDGFYALGYVRAEDRLKQMMFYFLMVSGRLAEHFGPGSFDISSLAPELAGYAKSAILKDTVESDKNYLQSRLLESARANFSTLSPQVQADIRAYMAGIKQYMKDHPEKVPAWAPPLEDAFPLANDALLTWYYAIQNGERNCAPQETETKKVSALDRDVLTRATTGSNGWVVGPNNTKDGVVIHLSDSHSNALGFGTIFYNWRIKAGDYDFLGFGDGSSPFPLFGHSSHFSWGWTDYSNRVSDCYKVETDAADPRRYHYDGKATTMITKPYKIRVKGQADITGEFEYTLHNGLLSPVVRREGKTAYVISTPYMGRAGLALQQYHDMAVAKSFGEFKAAMGQLSLFPDNLLVGGADGSIYYIKTGREPIRPEGIDGTTALDGNSSATAWRGIYPLERLMQIKDPAVGYLSNNNVSPSHVIPGSPLTADNYPSSFMINDHTTRRQLRALEVLASKPKMTVDDAIALALDIKLYGAEKWGPLVAAARKASTSERLKDPQFRQFLTALEGFDGYLEKSSKAALYHLETRNALALSFPKEIDAIAEAIEESKALSPAQSARILDAAAIAYDGIKARFGTIEVAYGDVHRIARGNHTYPASGGTVIAGYNIKHHSSTHLGSMTERVAIADTLKDMNFDFQGEDEKGRRNYISGQRIPFVTVFSKPVKSYSLMVFGTSDDPKSPHYADQAPLFSENVLKPTYFNWDELKSNALSRIDLVTRR